MSLLVPIDYLLYPSIERQVFLKELSTDKSYKTVVEYDLNYIKAFQKAHLGFPKCDMFNETLRENKKIRFQNILY